MPFNHAAQKPVKLPAKHEQKFTKTYKMDSSLYKIIIKQAGDCKGRNSFEGNGQEPRIFLAGLINQMRVCLC